LTSPQLDAPRSTEKNGVRPDGIIESGPAALHIMRELLQCGTIWFDMWRFVDGKADEHWDTDRMR